MQPFSPLTAAAHELKVPLSLISGMASILLEGECTNLRQREYLERILLSSDRLLKLVQSLADAYRVEQKEFTLQLEPVNVQHIVEEVAHDLTPHAQKLQKSLQIDIKRSVKMVVAHRGLMGEVVYSLVDNLLRCSESGLVTIRAMRQKECTRLSVQSEGLILSKRELDVLPQRLGAYVQPLSHQANSSGVSLHIVRQLTEAMGGKIGVEHRRKATSIFTDFNNSTQIALL